MMFDGLADKHPIKRTAVQHRKFVEVEDGSFIKWTVMSFSLLHHETFNRIG